MPLMRNALFALTFLLLAACVPPGARRAEPPEHRAVALVPPDRWPPIADDLDFASLAEAGKRSEAYLRGLGDRLLKAGDMEVGAAHLADTVSELVRLRRSAKNSAEFVAGLKAGFDLYRVSRSTDGSAFYSSYYQPTLPAAREPTRGYPYPIYRKPADMIEIDLGRFDPARRGEVLVGRLQGKDRLVPYFERRDIDVRGALRGKGLELAWLKEEFDRLNLHIQGSGILRFPDGGEALAAYAATNGRPYRSVGSAVVGAGAMTREEINAEALRRYLREHPEGEAWLISQNPRYTFFSLSPLRKGMEPSGSMGQPLVAGRSVAVDPKVFPLGAPAFAVFPMAQADASGRLLGKRETRRFVFAHDTGGAIQGPGRLDLYAGHGDEAQTTARNVWDAGTFHLLLKKLPPRTR